MRSRRCTLEVLPPSISLDTHTGASAFPSCTPLLSRHPSFLHAHLFASAPSDMHRLFASAPSDMHRLFASAPSDMHRLSAPGLHQPRLHKVLPAFINRGSTRCSRPSINRGSTRRRHHCCTPAPPRPGGVTSSPVTYCATRQGRHRPPTLEQASVASDTTRAGLRNCATRQGRHPEVFKRLRYARDRQHSHCGGTSKLVRQHPCAGGTSNADSAPCLFCLRHFTRARAHTAHTPHTHCTHTAHTPHTRRTHAAHILV